MNNKILIRIFIIWIILQLILLGMTVIKIEDEILRGTYECADRNKKTSSIWGAILPLIIFIPEKELIINYCYKDLLK